MKLYDADWAPSPRRVRLFLAGKGVEVERVRVDLRADRARIMWGAFVEAMDARLTNREWLATDGYSFARAAKLEVAERFGALAAWHARASARPSAGA